MSIATPSAPPLAPVRTIAKLPVDPLADTAEDWDLPLEPPAPVPPALTEEEIEYAHAHDFGGSW